MTNQSLRERAEQLLQTNPDTKPEVSTSDVQELIHELQLHQTELEMQNEELQDAYRQLGQSRDAYAELYDFAPVGYLTLDRDDIITEANYTAATLLGTERGNLVGCKFRRFVHPDFQPQWFQHRRALRSSGEKQTIELELQKADETPLTARLDCRPEGTIDTGDWHCLVALSDITEKTQAVNALQETYEQLKRTQNQLVDQERQRALTTMVSGIAHDFNNALTPIQGYAEMLVNNPAHRQDDAKLLLYLQRIQASASHAAETIRRLRKFYRPRDKQRLTDMNLNRAVTEAISDTRPRWQEESRAAGKPIDVQTSLAELPAVRANEAEIHEVLTNLLFNAVDALREGGTIHICTQAREGDIILEVSDNGIGMTNEEKRQCMNPFYTTKGPEISGLGLSTVQGIVHRHGGEVSIAATEGKGTTVTVSLPRTNTPTAEQATDTTGHRCYLNILVVEDEEMQRELLTELLGHDGHTSNVARDGTEAQRYFNNNSYDVVITDRAMPGMSGDQLAADLKKKAPDTPVIMLTGFGDMMDAVGEKPKNVDAVLSKPIKRENLQKAIAEVME